jgi:FtsP/CotA-like multicopper oxidase with cupredoxin domain
MTTGIDPYVVPDPTDDDSSATVLEIKIHAKHEMVNIGAVTAHAETFDGAIPGPTLRLNVDDTVIVRLINELDHPTGIHWHGIELSNSADGTEVTQEAVLPAFPVAPPAPAPAGGTYLYKFKVPRPGLYWYHPHHHLSTNRVFRGMYGMIVVKDPNETALIAAGVLPGAADTKQIVLSDITVCKAAGSNDNRTYPDPTLLPPADQPEWLSGVTSQPPPSPLDLCEIPPTGSATNDDHTGTAATNSYAAGDIPSIIRTARVNEGQTVLTNGMDVGARLGTPSAPGALAAAARTLDVRPGQGLRLQIANCATIRYFRLILTTSTGVQVPLVRIGGEGGLLDNAVVEGGVISGFDTKYSRGEILLPPGSRADVVAAIPDSLAPNSVLTLWTRDFSRTGGGFSNTPTVPVMHLKVTGAVVAPAYAIDGGVDGVGGTALRASIPGAAVEILGTPSGALLDPATFMPAKFGRSNQDIQITTALTGGGPPTPSIDGVKGGFEDFTPYTDAPHIDSSRFAKQGDTLELTVTNNTNAHHPFHLHGFSIQPISLTRPGFASFIWPYREFRDNVDVPANYTLKFRVRLDARELLDGATPGGALGRWLFHCHIFFHHHQGMISELVVTAADGSEKPDVDVAGSWAYTPSGAVAERHGTYDHPDGDAVTLSASRGIVTDDGAGKWSWSFDSTGIPTLTEYVYITATDAAGRKDQAVFRLKIGAPDDGSDNGDPHVHTVDGKSYDFQAVGEFTLLRDVEGMEVQARHWPVETANPVTDSHTGLTSCVSVNRAVAARVGTHRISYQPGREGQLEFYLDGKPAPLPREGMDLGAHRLTAFAVTGGAMAVRVDYASQAVLTITPYFWESQNIWLLNVSVSHTQADEGIMGIISPSSWLPALPNGTNIGPMPATLHDRYITLYKTFANAWRVTDDTSLFVYTAGTSTKTFTDEDWPAEKFPCKLKPQFRIPDASPILSNIPIAAAKKICQRVGITELNRDCVFDVTTTGDKDFAKAYLVEQDLKLHGTSVQILASKPRTQPGEALMLTATILPLKCARPTPTGTITFFIDGLPVGSPVKLDKRGRASFTTTRLVPGDHSIRATYGGGGRHKHRPSSSPNLLHMVRKPEKPDVPAPHGTHTC